MDASDMALQKALKQKMSYLSERQRVLAQNVANVNTPKYKPKDITEDFGTILAGKSNKIKLATTHPGHIAGGKDMSRFHVEEVPSSETKPNGNAVVVEEEMLKMQKTNLDYQSSIEIYRKVNQMLAAALGNNG